MSTKQNKFSRNSYFMSLALREAQKVLGNTKTNPAVGCVIVKNNCVISSGSTGLNGIPHAESAAIKSSGKNARNACMYVTLEPCSHYGKTPPCVKTIIRNKIKKVYFSIKDPDLRSFDKSSKQLKKNKISVRKGIGSKEVSFFYRSYQKFKNDNLLFVTCKLAVSKDFYTIDKKNKCITNDFSRGRVHLMRSNHDCIITSVKTVIKDNPRFTCRIKGLENRTPVRIILDSKLRIPLSTKIIKKSMISKTIIFYSKLNERKIKILKSLNVKLIKAPILKNGYFDLKIILLKIKQLGFSRVFLESGLKLAANFLNDNLVDDFRLFISNKNLGIDGEGNIKKYYKLFLNNKKKSIERVNLFGDKLINFKLK